MKTRIIFIVLLAILLLSFTIIHPYHVSVTTLNYNGKENKLTIELKAFYHDLEPTVIKFTGVDYDIKNHTPINTRDSLTLAYVLPRYNLKINDKKIELGDAKIRFADEYIYFSFNVLFNEIKPTKIEIENTICFDSEKTQLQLFHFIENGHKTTRKASNPNGTAIFFPAMK